MGMEQEVDNPKQVLEELLQSSGCWKAAYKHWAVKDGGFVAIVPSNFDSTGGNDADKLKVCLSGICATVDLAEEAAANDAIQYMTRRPAGGFVAPMHVDVLDTTMSVQATLDSVYQVAEGTNAEAED